MEKCSSKKVYYVHNLTFEIFVFLNYFVKRGVKFKLVSANKIVYAAEIIIGKKKIKLRCSYRLTMLSLKELAKLAGEEEKDVFPYKILNENLKEIIHVEEKMFNTKEEYIAFKNIKGEVINTYKVLEEYCKNDAVITKKSVIKYWKIIEEGGLKRKKNILTAAKLSIENYFSKETLVKKKIPIKYDRLLRPFYFGGNTSVYGNPYQDEILLQFDWSGMYAQCMSEKVLGGMITYSELMKNIEEPGIYYVKFRQNLNMPILPVKGEKLLFPNGEFEGWYWFEELCLAKSRGVEILAVEKVITSQYYDTFMKEFIEKNNEIRKKGGLYKQIGKNNNNTLYGRLGMDPERLEEEIISNVEDWNNYNEVKEVNGIFLGYKKTEKSISNILIALQITAKARVRLYKGIEEVQKVGGRIMYTDTDSIIAAFKKEEYKKILDTKIGEVYFDSKKEDTIILDGVFAMPKTYALKFENGKEIVKIKGFNVRPDFQNFKETFYKQGCITTLNMEWSKKDFNMQLVEKEKTTSLAGLDKRKWTKDLKRTLPLEIW